MGTVHSLDAARKAKTEEGQVMHYAGIGSERNPHCYQCRRCTVCGETACNINESGHGQLWTDDLVIWADHSNPCKQLPLIGGGNNG